MTKWALLAVGAIGLGLAVLLYQPATHSSRSLSVVDETIWQAQETAQMLEDSMPPTQTIRPSYDPSQDRILALSRIAARSVDEDEELASLWDNLFDLDVEGAISLLTDDRSLLTSMPAASFAKLLRLSEPGLNSRAFIDLRQPDNLSEPQIAQLVEYLLLQEPDSTIELIVSKMAPSPVRKEALLTMLEFSSTHVDGVDFLNQYHTIADQQFRDLVAENFSNYQWQGSKQEQSIWISEQPSDSIYRPHLKPILREFVPYLNLADLISFMDACGGIACKSSIAEIYLEMAENPSRDAIDYLNAYSESAVD